MVLPVGLGLGVEQVFACEQFARDTDDPAAANATLGEALDEAMQLRIAAEYEAAILGGGAAWLRLEQAFCRAYSAGRGLHTLAGRLIGGV